MLLDAMFSNPLSVAREMDRLFDSMSSTQPFGFVPTIRAQWTFPPVNLLEDDSAIHAEAELPGIALKDIEVFVADDQLTIRGVREAYVPEGGRPLRRERPVGRFERTITLPAPVDADHVEAKLTNGVLTITLPKSAAAKPRRIEVKALSGS